MSVKFSIVVHRIVTFTKLTTVSQARRPQSINDSSHNSGLSIFQKDLVLPTVIQNSRSDSSLPVRMVVCSSENVCGRKYQTFVSEMRVTDECPSFGTTENLY